MLFGRNLGWGSAYRCSFGNLVAHATYHNETGSVECVVPADPGRRLPGDGPLDVRVTLAVLSASKHVPAARALAPGTFRFVDGSRIDDAAVADSVFPRSGPTVGGTAVRVRGRFMHGLAYSCVFGARRVPAVLLGQNGAQESVAPGRPAPWAVLDDSTGFLTLRELGRRARSGKHTAIANASDAPLAAGPLAAAALGGRAASDDAGSLLHDVLVCLSPLHALPGEVRFRVEATREGSSAGSATADAARREALVDRIASALGEAVGRRVPKGTTPQGLGTASRLLKPLTRLQELRRTAAASEGRYVSREQAAGEDGEVLWEQREPPAPVSVEVEGAGLSFSFHAPFVVGEAQPRAAHAGGGTVVRVPVDVSPPPGSTPACHFRAVPGWSSGAGRGLAVTVAAVWDASARSLACVVPSAAAMLRHDALRHAHLPAATGDGGPSLLQAGGRNASGLRPAARRTGLLGALLDDEESMTRRAAAHLVAGAAGTSGPDPELPRSAMALVARDGQDVASAALAMLGAAHGEATAPGAAAALRRLDALARQPLVDVVAAFRALGRAPGPFPDPQPACNATVAVLDAMCEGGAVAAVLGRSRAGESSVRAAAAAGCGGDAGARGLPGGPGGMTSLGRAAGAAARPGTACGAASFGCLSLGVVLREHLPRCALAALQAGNDAGPAPQELPAVLPDDGSVVGVPPTRVLVSVSFNGADPSPAAGDGALTLLDPRFRNATLAAHEGAASPRGVAVPAFRPAAGPARGGQRVVVTGLPLSLLARAPDGPSCSPGGRNGSEPCVDAALHAALGGAWRVPGSPGPSRLRHVLGAVLSHVDAWCVFGNVTARAAAEVDLGGVPAAALSPSASTWHADATAPTLTLACVSPSAASAAPTGFGAAGFHVRVNGIDFADFPLQTRPILPEQGVCVRRDAEAATTGFAEAMPGPPAWLRRFSLVRPADILAVRWPHLPASLRPTSSAPVCGEGSVAIPSGVAAHAPLFSFLASPALVSPLPASVVPGAALRVQLAFPAHLLPPVDATVRLRVGDTVVPMLATATHVVAGGGAAVTSGQGALVLPRGVVRVAAGALEGDRHVVLVQLTGTLPSHCPPGRSRIELQAAHGAEWLRLHSRLLDPFAAGPARASADRAVADALALDWSRAGASLLARLIAGPNSTADEGRGRSLAIRLIEDGADAARAQAPPATLPSSSAVFVHPAPHVSVVNPPAVAPDGGDAVRVGVVMLRAAPAVLDPSGGTRVMVRATGLGGGRDFMCRFGAVAVPAAFHERGIATAGEDADDTDADASLLQSDAGSGDPAGWVDGMHALHRAALRHPGGMGPGGGFTLWDLERERAREWHEAAGSSLGGLRRSFVGDGGPGDGGATAQEALDRARDGARASHTVMLQRAGSVVKRRRRHLMQPGPSSPPGWHHLTCVAPSAAEVGGAALARRLESGTAARVAFAVSLNGGASWTGATSPSPSRPTPDSLIFAPSRLGLSIAPADVPAEGGGLVAVLPAPRPGAGSEPQPEPSGNTSGLESDRALLHSVVSAAAAAVPSLVPDAAAESAQASLLHPLGAGIAEASPLCRIAGTDAVAAVRGGGAVLCQVPPLLLLLARVQASGCAVDGPKRLALRRLSDGRRLRVGLRVEVSLGRGGPFSSAGEASVTVPVGSAAAAALCSSASRACAAIRGTRLACGAAAVPNAVFTPESAPSGEGATSVIVSVTGAAERAQALVSAACAGDPDQCGAKLWCLFGDLAVPARTVLVDVAAAVRGGHGERSVVECAAPPAASVVAAMLDPSLGYRFGGEAGGPGAFRDPLALPDDVTGPLAPGSSLPARAANALGEAARHSNGTGPFQGLHDVRLGVHAPQPGTAPSVAGIGPRAQPQPGSVPLAVPFAVLVTAEHPAARPGSSSEQVPAPVITLNGTVLGRGSGGGPHGVRILGRIEARPASGRGALLNFLPSPPMLRAEPPLAVDGKRSRSIITAEGGADVVRRAFRLPSGDDEQRFVLATTAVASPLRLRLGRRITRAALDGSARMAVTLPRLEAGTAALLSASFDGQVWHARGSGALVLGRPVESGRSVGCAAIPPRWDVAPLGGDGIPARQDTKLPRTPPGGPASPASGVLRCIIVGPAARSTLDPSGADLGNWLRSVGAGVRPAEHPTRVDVGAATMWYEVPAAVPGSAPDESAPGLQDAERRPSGSAVALAAADLTPWKLTGSPPSLRPCREPSRSCVFWLADLPLGAAAASPAGPGSGGTLWVSHVSFSASLGGGRAARGFRKTVRDFNDGHGWAVPVWRPPSTWFAAERAYRAAALQASRVLERRALGPLGAGGAPLGDLAVALSAALHSAGAVDDLGLRGGSLFRPMSAAAAGRNGDALSRGFAAPAGEGDAVPSAAPALGRVLVRLTGRAAATARASDEVVRSLLQLSAGADSTGLHLGPDHGSAPPPSHPGSHAHTGHATGGDERSAGISPSRHHRVHGDASAAHPVGTHAASRGGATGSQAAFAGGLAAPPSMYGSGSGPRWAVVVPGTAAVADAALFAADAIAPSLVSVLRVMDRGRAAVAPLHRSHVAVGLQQLQPTVVLVSSAGRSPDADAASPDTLGAGSDAEGYEWPAGQRSDDSRAAGGLSEEDASASGRPGMGTVAWSSGNSAVLDVDSRVVRPDGSSSLVPFRASPAPGEAPRRLRPSLLLRVRLSVASMADTPIPFPLSPPARPEFDAAITADVAAAIGVEEHRLAVLSADPSTGDVVIRCVDGTQAGDAPCSAEALRAAEADESSPLRSGMVGFNTVRRRGRCSNGRYRTEGDCLGVGQCSCRFMARDDREGCESAVSVSGQPCSFSRDNTWDGEAEPVEAGRCTDPRLRGKDACLEAGACSEQGLDGRTACLSAGACVPPATHLGPGMNTVNRPVFDFAQFRTREECVDPSARSAGTGRCVTPAGSSDPAYRCGRHGARLQCTDPASRAALPGTHACVRRPGGQAYDYTRLRTRETCETPSARGALCALGAADEDDLASPSGSRPFFLQTAATRAAGTPSEVEPPPWPSQPDLIFRPEPGGPAASGLSAAADTVRAASGPPGFARDDAVTTGTLFGYRPSSLQLRDDQTPADAAAALVGTPPSGAPGTPAGDASLPVPPGSAAPASSSASALSCGPAGVWAPTSSLLAKGPPCEWRADPSGSPCRYGRPGPCLPDTDSGELAMQAAQLPGQWIADNQFAADNEWSEPGSGQDVPCPCEWQSDPYHLKRCNWWHCGPAKKGASADGIIQFYRNKHNNEHVSDYNANVKIGGSNMWMQLDTSTATTWVMSMACFTVGCAKVKMYSGMYIPAMPPMPAPIDLLEGGIFQILSMVGLDGHTMVDLGGVSSMGAPFQMGILDLGTISPMSFNHTGRVGLAYWEENWPWQLLIIDPMLSVLDFMRCGSIFYPIPMVPIPTPKNFPMWARPPFFPSGFMLKFAFFFGDTGGCFFLNSVPSAFSRGGMSQIMLMPMPGIKLLNPSWMFMLGDVRVGGRPLKPCLIPAMCRGHFATGQFSVTGPLFPMLALLEAVAAPLTCEHIESLPPVTFVIMGQSFTMQRQDYTILGWSFDSVQCMTAFTPEFQLIPGMDLWGMGDSFIRAFYLQLNVQPLRSAKLGLADQPYYEKNGCKGGGIGPVAKVKPSRIETAARKGADARNAATSERGKGAKSMFWKRRQNWEDDLKGMQANRAESGKRAALDQDDCSASVADGGSPRFRTSGGRCIAGRFHDELSSRSVASALPSTVQDGPASGELLSASDAMFGSDAGGSQLLLQASGRQRGVQGHSAVERAEPVDPARPEDFDTGGMMRSMAGLDLSPADRLPGSQGKAESQPTALGDARTVADLPAPLRAALDNITNGLATASTSRIARLAASAPVTDHFLHTDMDRLLALPPDQRNNVALSQVDAVRKVTEMAWLDGKDRLADRIRSGTEPPAWMLPRRPFGQAQRSGDDGTTIQVGQVGLGEAGANGRASRMSRAELQAAADAERLALTGDAALSQILRSFGGSQRPANRDGESADGAYAGSSLWMPFLVPHHDDGPEGLGRMHADAAVVSATPPGPDRDKAFLQLSGRRADRAIRHMHALRPLAVAGAHYAASGAAKSHDAVLLQAFGYGSRSCAADYSGVDPATLPGQPRGDDGPMTYTGEAIGCDASGSPVILPRLNAELAETAADKSALVRNMSAVMRHIAAALNVSEAAASQYWRGESEAMQRNLTRRTLRRYRVSVEEAQARARAHGLASQATLEALRAITMRQTTSPEEAHEAVRQAMERILHTAREHEQGAGRTRRKWGAFPFNPESAGMDAGAELPEARVQAAAASHIGADEAKLHHPDLRSAANLLARAGKAAHALAGSASPSWDEVRIRRDPGTGDFELVSRVAGADEQVLMRSSHDGSSAGSAITGDEGDARKVAVLLSVHTVGRAHHSSLEAGVERMSVALRQAEVAFEQELAEAGEVTP